MKTIPRILVLGFPSLYGGAGTELHHQIIVWLSMGREVHLIPTYDVSHEPLLPDMLGRGVHVHAPANYPWDEESSSVPSSSSSSSQKLILILEEDGNTVVADESGTKYDWAWEIRDANGGQSSSGNEGSHTARYVGQHVATMHGISNREGAFAGQEVTIAFASRDANGVWKPNGWSVTAKKYEVLGVNDKDLQGLRAI